MAKTLWGIVFVLVLALLLFWSGWFCASSARDGESVEAVRGDLAAESKVIQDKIDARLDRIEGKIDAILKIATAQPPDMKRKD